MVDQTTTFFFLSYDKSAENIFSNNIETWKNMGNVQFIDQVGQCFSAMNSINDYWRDWTIKINEIGADINNNPDNYEGDTWAMKCLRSEKIRHNMQAIHTMRCWLQYTAASMRYHNRRNMDAIGIDEQAVMDYTNVRQEREDNEDDTPNPNDYYTPTFDPDSLTSMRHLDAQIDSLKGNLIDM